MWHATYKMGYGVPVSGERYHAYRTGKLSEWEIVMIYQEMLEALCVPAVNMEHATYMIEMGLCHIPGRVLQ